MKTIHGNRKFPEDVASFRSKASNYMSHAKIRGINWELSIERTCAILAQDCHYCGSPPSMKHKSILYNGIDRRHNELGYLDENVVACCTTCNQAKMNMSLKRFEKWIEGLVNYQTKWQN